MHTMSLTCDVRSQEDISLLPTFPIPTILFFISLKQIPKITLSAVMLFLHSVVIYRTNICTCVYHGSGPLLVLLPIMLSTEAKALLFRPLQLCSAEHLDSQPVVNHLYRSLTVCQTHLGCTLQVDTQTMSLF